MTSYSENHFSFEDFEKNKISRTWNQCHDVTSKWTFKADLANIFNCNCVIIIAVVVRTDIALKTFSRRECARSREIYDSLEYPALVTCSINIRIHARVRQFLQSKARVRWQRRVNSISWDQPDKLNRLWPTPSEVPAISTHRRTAFHYLTGVFLSLRCLSDRTRFCWWS